MGTTEFTARHFAMLRAVAEGRGQIVAGCQPNLTVDGLWCDFMASSLLFQQALVRPAGNAPMGTRSPAVLTPSGVEALGAVTVTAE